MTAPNRTAFFTEGPLDDDDAPDFLKEMRVKASLRARARVGDKNLDHIHTRIFRELPDFFGHPEKKWTDAEDDALLALVDEMVLLLCNGGLFQHDYERCPDPPHA